MPLIYEIYSLSLNLLKGLCVGANPSHHHDGMGWTGLEMVSCEKVLILHNYMRYYLNVVLLDYVRRAIPYSNGPAVPRLASAFQRVQQGRPWCGYINHNP